ncbi:hypothetical protein BSQ98_25505 [Serratia liquefaciens]|uniref:hypothetical protein n=1 Tax=Serratia liquefaciens TaxID=614 RepID=UPI001020C4E5|nr:hypothetical protein [Serratia liquefaciens]RYM57872.1 hypothetical protein BSQ98_25505 [Serratia liquefaciens]
MEMKNRPVQQAASQKVGTSDNSAITTIKPAPKKHRARVYMLKTGVNGWTENDILKYCRLSSGRNYASELERCLDIQLERIDEKNPDGIGSHFRYRFVSCADVLRVIQLVNHNATAGGYHGLSQSDIANILTLYPDAFTAA